MKVLLDIQDKKAASLLEVLKGLSYVKTKPLTKANAEFLEDAKTAIDCSVPTFLETRFAKRSLRR
jgi:hypothetical protein